MADLVVRPLGRYERIALLQGKDPEIGLVVWIYKQAIQDYMNAIRKIGNLQQKGCASRNSERYRKAEAQMKEARDFILEDPYGILSNPEEWIRALNRESGRINGNDRKKRRKK